jgi:hypothetical protein
MKKKILYFIAVVIFVTFGSLALNAQMIVTITENVETEFGTYQPYSAEYTPNVPLFTVASDFSNVENFYLVSSRFSAIDSSLLLKNYFTVKKSQYTQMYDVYNICTWDGIPIFVTTDAVLHTYHVLFDRFLAELETQIFIPALDLLSETLINETQTVFSEATTAETQEAARRNLAFLYVSQKLLKGSEISVPDTVAGLVDAELELIADHNGFSFSPVFGAFSELDYSQFIPRGHYTKNDTLTAYFKAMMWQGWTIFTMEPQFFGDLAKQHTLQALLLVQMVYNLEAEGKSLLDLWDLIYEPTVFFVGKSDDPNIRNYKTIAEEIYGDGFLNLSPEDLNDDTLLEAFMTEAQKLPDPKIPNWIYGSFTTYKGFRFMGQRFIPDSYMFAHLVLPEIGERYFPKGLDVMSILGSERADKLLDTLYNETAYPNYTEKIAEFKTEFSTLEAKEWAQNLYWNWLYCLMPLLYEKGEGYPFFMQNVAWLDKELTTALASWAELRHDTILYAKQSMSPCGIAPGAPRSYVEPNPDLYARLASLVRFTRDGLASRDLLLEGFQDKLDLFETLLVFLRDVSIKELENTALTESEYDNIYCFGKVMHYLVSDADDPQVLWNVNVDNMAVVADVHTDSNTDRCLEEGVGYPREIYVIVNEGGNTRITRGAIFSYYEFLQAIAERLTDEQWREMLASDAPPEMPEWVKSFTDESSPQPQLVQHSEDNLFTKEFSLAVSQDIIPLPEKIQLSQNYPNPFNAETVIRYHVPDNGYVMMNVYNLRGQKIRTLLSNYQNKGQYDIIWDSQDDRGAKVSSGVYFLQLQMANRIQTIKMILLQ